MKKIGTQFFVLSLLLQPFSTAFAAIKTYTLDPQHTYVLWHINHFGFSNPSGKWMAEGTLSLDEAKPQNSKVDVTVHVANLVTGIPELDTHLKGKLFFNADQFPTAKFTSDKVKMTGKKTAQVDGKLTLKNVTKPIKLKVTLNKLGENPITSKMTVGFSATTQLKRSDYDINTLLPGLGDEVTINIEAEGYQ